MERLKACFCDRCKGLRWEICEGLFLNQLVEIGDGQKEEGMGRGGWIHGWTQQVESMRFVVSVYQSATSGMWVARLFIRGVPDWFGLPGDLVDIHGRESHLLCEGAPRETEALAQLSLDEAMKDGLRKLLARVAK